MKDDFKNNSDMELEDLWERRKRSGLSDELVKSLRQEVLSRDFVISSDDFIVGKRSLFFDKGHYLKKIFNGIKSNTSSYFTSLFWTIFLTVFYFSLHRIALPIVGPLLEKLWESKNPFISSMNILDLGLYPVFNGFLCVEIFSLFLKPLCDWRLKGSSGREKLNRCAWGLSLLFSMINGLGTSFLVLNYCHLSNLKISPSPGVFFHLLNVTTLVAGTFLGVWIAQLITEKGVGNGFLILYFAYFIKGIILNGISQFRDFQKSRPTSNEEFSFVVSGVLLLLSLVFIWKFLNRTPRILLPGRNGKKLWYEISPFPSGIVFQAYTLLILGVLAIVLSSENFSSQWLTKGWSHIALEILLTSLLCFIFYNWIWGEIDVFGLNIENLSVYIEKRESPLNRQFWLSLGILLFGAILFWVNLGGPNVHSFLWLARFSSMIGCLAIFQDLWKQWIFWKANGQGKELLVIDNVHLAAYIKGLFLSEGIPCYIQGYIYRRLLFVFGPLYKMRLLVPDEWVEKAGPLLASIRYQVL